MLIDLKSVNNLFFKSLQTLCECALTSPYNSLKLGMLAVLSTLSGTIAIKQYFNNMPGFVIFTSLCLIFNYGFPCYLYTEEGNDLGLICIPLKHPPQVPLQFPSGSLTWLNWHKNAVTTATWLWPLTGS